MLTADDFTRAFTARGAFPEREQHLLRALLAAYPAGVHATTLIPELKAKHLVEVNASMGAVGRAIFEILRSHPEGFEAGSYEYWTMIATGEHDSDGFIWKLRPEVAEALNDIGIPEHVIHTASRLSEGAAYSRDALRQLFGISDATINNGVFQPRGHDSVWLFVTESKTRDRTQYQDYLDGDTLHFDGQTQGRTDELLVDHKRRGFDVLVFYRATKTEFDGYSFRYEGAFQYESHEGDRPKKFIFRRKRVSDLVVNATEAARVLSKRRISQGISVSPRVRIALEKFSMDLAIERYSKEGYVVEDVHLTHPVDLLCRKNGTIRRVEVKATQTLGDEILLTPNEVTYAKENAGEMDLFIVHSLNVQDGDDVAITGGTVDVVDWIIDDARLRPVGFRYSVRDRE